MEHENITKVLLVGFGALSDFAKETAACFPRYKIYFDRSAAEGLKQTGGSNVLVQPTFLLPGIEYEKMRAEAVDCGQSIAVGEPLLTDRQSIEALADILAKEYQGSDVLFIGHGTTHPAGAIYFKLYLAMQKTGLNAFMGVLEGERCLETVIEEIRARGLDSILLVPLMMTTGKHVREEIISDRPGSWRSILGQQGIKTKTVDRALLEYPAVRDMISASIYQTITREFNYEI